MRQESMFNACGKQISQFQPFSVHGNHLKLSICKFTISYKEKSLDLLMFTAKSNQSFGLLLSMPNSMLARPLGKTRALLRHLGERLIAMSSPSTDGPKSPSSTKPCPPTPPLDRYRPIRPRIANASSELEFFGPYPGPDPEGRRHSEAEFALDFANSFTDSEDDDEQSRVIDVPHSQSINESQSVFASGKGKTRGLATRVTEGFRHVFSHSKSHAFDQNEAPSGQPKSCNVRTGAHIYCRHSWVDGCRCGRRLRAHGGDYCGRCWRRECPGPAPETPS